MATKKIKFAPGTKYIVTRKDGTSTSHRTDETAIRAANKSKGGIIRNQTGVQMIAIDEKTLIPKCAPTANSLIKLQEHFNSRRIL